jgi:hypothetical protein
MRENGALFPLWLPNEWRLPDIICKDPLLPFSAEEFFRFSLNNPRIPFCVLVVAFCLLFRFPLLQNC